MYKVIKSHPNYEINEEGKIRNVVTNKYLKLNIGTHGYYVVQLFDGYGHGKWFLVHRLVAKYFVPNLENKPCVNHIDKNRLNPHYSNLEWVTYSENNLHGECNVKEYTLKKDGKLFKIRNLKAFCEENNLNYKALNNLVRGKSKSSQGFTTQ